VDPAVRAAVLLPAAPVAVPRLLVTVVALLLAVRRPVRMVGKVDLLPVKVALVVLVLAVADHLPNRSPRSKSV
jgi:hypothetical protein